MILLSRGHDDELLVGCTIGIRHVIRGFFFSPKRVIRGFCGCGRIWADNDRTPNPHLSFPSSFFLRSFLFL
jgi:hypothetical protein